MKNLFLFIAGAALGAGGYYIYNESNKPKAIDTLPGSNVPNGTVIYSSSAQAPSGTNFGRSVTGKPNYGKRKKRIQLPHIF